MFEEEDSKEINVEDLPLYKKGVEIFDVANQIVELISDDNEQLQDIKGWILSDAMQLTVKIAGAHNIDLYDMKMEAATIIRKSARDLILHQHSLRDFGFKETEYFNIIRELVEEYRLLFIDWVASFNQWDYIIDKWGLFNPPGVSPFDHDPDDDIPFDGFKDFE
ncbi:MAG: hypothetical protein DRI74_08255 [Bacteroidetes bacterium]|nr:MAG: hypothetical protein DRI74_08255 [Bacteroidota bacterium]